MGCRISMHDDHAAVFREGDHNHDKYRSGCSSIQGDYRRYSKINGIEPFQPLGLDQQQSLRLIE
ncbi:hypothetical protein GNF86_24185 [Clostridium perfringens]